MYQEKRTIVSSYFWMIYPSFVLSYFFNICITEIKTWSPLPSTPLLFLSECSCFDLLVFISRCQVNVITPTPSFNNHFLFSHLSDKCSDSYETFHIWLKFKLIWRLNKYNSIEGPKLSNNNSCWKIIAIKIAKVLIEAFMSS